jgi:hypothetical protein
MIPFAQLEQHFWAEPPGSAALWIKIFIGLVLGFGLMIGLTYVPMRGRRPIVATVTFLMGLFWVLRYVWPAAIDRGENELPLNAVEAVSFTLADMEPVVSQFTNIITGLMIGLGVYSLLRIHIRRFAKMQKDWAFSLVLLVSMLAMMFFGYWDWIQRQGPEGALLDDPQNWAFPQYGRDFLFDGLLQQLDAAMFSLIAFFILSAAYRAFRVRSVEATILLATALIVMLSLMGAVTYMWDTAVVTVGGDNHLVNNLQLTNMSRWLRDTFQVSSIRGIDFGVGIGALAMGLRLWLSLERTGGNM